MSRMPPSPDHPGWCRTQSRASSASQPITSTQRPALILCCLLLFLLAPSPSFSLPVSTVTGSPPPSNSTKQTSSVVPSPVPTASLQNSSLPSLSSPTLYSPVDSLPWRDCHAYVQTKDSFFIIGGRAAIGPAPIPGGGPIIPVLPVLAATLNSTSTSTSTSRPNASTTQQPAGPSPITRLSESSNTSALPGDLVPVQSPFAGTNSIWSVRYIDLDVSSISHSDAFPPLFGLSCVTDDSKLKIYCTGGFPTPNLTAVPPGQAGPTLYPYESLVIVDVPSGVVSTHNLTWPVDQDGTSVSRGFHASVFYNNSIFMFGGIPCYQCPVPTLSWGRQHIATISSAIAFIPPSSTSSLFPSTSNFGRNGSILLIGGASTNISADGTRAYPAANPQLLWSFDIATHNITPIAVGNADPGSVPSPRYGHSCAVSNDDSSTIWVQGGGAPGFDPVDRNLWRLNISNPANYTWQLIVPSKSDQNSLFSANATLFGSLISYSTFVLVFGGRIPGMIGADGRTGFVNVSSGATLASFGNSSAVQSSGPFTVYYDGSALGSSLGSLWSRANRFARRVLAQLPTPRLLRRSAVQESGTDSDQIQSPRRVAGRKSALSTAATATARCDSSMRHLSTLTGLTSVPSVSALSPPLAATLPSSHRPSKPLTISTKAAVPLVLAQVAQTTQAPPIVQTTPAAQTAKISNPLKATPFELASEPLASANQPSDTNASTVPPGLPLRYTFVFDTRFDTWSPQARTLVANSPYDVDSQTSASDSGPLIAGITIGLVALLVVAGIAVNRMRYQAKPGASEDGATDINKSTARSAIEIARGADSRSNDSADSLPFMLLLKKKHQSLLQPQQSANLEMNRLVGRQLANRPKAHFAPSSTPGPSTHVSGAAGSSGSGLQLPSLIPNSRPMHSSPLAPPPVALSTFILDPRSGLPKRLDSIVKKAPGANSVDFDDDEDFGFEPDETDSSGADEASDPAAVSDHQTPSPREAHNRSPSWATSAAVDDSSEYSAARSDDPLIVATSSLDQASGTATPCSHTRPTKVSESMQSIEHFQVHNRPRFIMSKTTPNASTGFTAGEMDRSSQDHDDEIDLRTGEIVTIAYLYNDGWAKGWNLTSGRIGVFPFLCVQQMMTRSGSRRSSRTVHSEKRLSKLSMARMSSYNSELSTGQPSLYQTHILEFDENADEEGIDMMPLASSSNDATTFISGGTDLGYESQKSSFVDADIETAASPASPLGSVRSLATHDTVLDESRPADAAGMADEPVVAGAPQSAAAAAVAGPPQLPASQPTPIQAEPLDDDFSDMGDSIGSSELGDFDDDEE
ncbi:uncharacterized protein BJ171DRAFT_504984 [Polychytrium aggregatum]|uniref:uncharacterized protein n=1 Tax=Polychytrium aggregatum TaxID=110093 RepID=UPI0022FF45A3|nr:uncharacterized protein BJ171DRAFT_504984 [Polychytrium aggregatum]KAI9204653.1 hypothetical protein BJ171DRAFT_504984 [Polychytrium aggregatum]